jgi:hypothetical protein
VCPRSNTEAPCAREPQPRLGVPIYLVRSLLRAGICTRGQPMRRLPGWTIPRPEALIPNPRARNNEPLISSRYQGDQAYSLKIDHPNQVWAMDITYVRLEGGAVVEAKAEWDRLTVKLARNRVTKSSTPEGASSEALTDPDPCQSRR